MHFLSIIDFFLMSEPVFWD